MLKRLVYGVWGVAFAVLLCLSCTDTEDSATTMAEEISGGASDAQVIQASLPPEPPSVPTTIELGVDFTGAVAPATAEDYAKLSFALDGAPDGKQTMEMLNPRKPDGASLKLGFCTVDVEPRICAAKTKAGDQCSALGGYAVYLADKAGKPMGEFVIDESGCLRPECGKTAATDYATQLTFSSTADGHKTRYMVFPRQVREGDKYEALLAVEYESNAEATAHQLDAPDGWSYTYTFPDGTLRVYPFEALADLKDEVQRDTRAAAKGGGGLAAVGGASCGTGSSGGG